MKTITLLFLCVSIIFQGTLFAGFPPRPVEPKEELNPFERDRVQLCWQQAGGSKVVFFKLLLQAEIEKPTDITAMILPKSLSLNISGVPKGNARLKALKQAVQAFLEITNQIMQKNYSLKGSKSFEDHLCNLSGQLLCDAGICGEQY